MSLPRDFLAVTAALALVVLVVYEKQEDSRLLLQTGSAWSWGSKATAPPLSPEAVSDYSLKAKLYKQAAKEADKQARLALGDKYFADKLKSASSSIDSNIAKLQKPAATKSKKLLANLAGSLRQYAKALNPDEDVEKPARATTHHAGPLTSAVHADAWKTEFSAPAQRKKTSLRMRPVYMLMCRSELIAVCSSADGPGEGGESRDRSWVSSQRLQDLRQLADGCRGCLSPRDKLAKDSLI
eukprot:746944-Hanusia_phi.AAC.2